MNYFKIACVPTEEVSGHLYVCWGCTNWGSERSSVCVLVMVSMLLVYQLRKWAVICMCVGDGVDVACVPTEEVSGHLYVCWCWCRWCFCFYDFQIGFWNCFKRCGNFFSFSSHDLHCIFIQFPQLCVINNLIQFYTFCLYIYTFIFL